DEGVRKNLIELSLRMGQPALASAELESYLSYLQSNNHGAQGVTFIEELLTERPDDPILRRALAQAYQQTGRTEEAIAQLDSVAEVLLTADKNVEAIALNNEIVV